MLCGAADGSVEALCSLKCGSAPSQCTWLKLTLAVLPESPSHRLPAGLRGGGPQPGQHGHLLCSAQPAVGLRPRKSSSGGTCRPPLPATVEVPGCLLSSLCHPALHCLPPPKLTTPHHSLRRPPFGYFPSFTPLSPHTGGGTLIKLCSPSPVPPSCHHTHQVVDLLIKLYKFPNFSISRALLHGTPTAPTTPRSPAAAGLGPSGPSTSGPSASAVSTSSSVGPDVPIGGRVWDCAGVQYGGVLRAHGPAARLRPPPSPPPPGPRAPAPLLNPCLPAPTHPARPLQWGAARARWQMRCCVWRRASTEPACPLSKTYARACSPSYQARVAGMAVCLRARSL